MSFKKFTRYENSLLKVFYLMSWVVLIFEVPMFMVLVEILPFSRKVLNVLHVLNVMVHVTLIVLLKTSISRRLNYPHKLSMQRLIVRFDFSEKIIDTSSFVSAKVINKPEKSTMYCFDKPNVELITKDETIYFYSDNPGDLVKELNCFPL